MRGRLGEIAERLGYDRRKVEVFPKQERLLDKDDFGSWINLPYFGATRHSIDAAGNDIPLADFLTRAEELRQPRAWFDEPLAPGPGASKKKSGEVKDKKATSEADEPEKDDEPDPKDGTKCPIESFLTKAVQKIQDGSEGRNDAGIWLFIQLAAEGYEYDECERIIPEWVRMANEAGVKTDPYTVKEAKASIKSAFKKPREKNLWKFPLTDHGNAERLQNLYGESLRYCHKWKKWLVWDGRRWKNDATAGVMRCAQKTARKMLKSAAKITDPELRKNAFKWAIHTDNTYGLKAMVEVAQAFEGIATAPEEFDADPMLLNLQNGTFDLRTCTSRPHNPKDLITKMCQVDYAPNAKCPVWEQFQRTATEIRVERAPDSEGQLHLVTGQEDAEHERIARQNRLYEYKQRLIGYSLSGQPREKLTLFIYYGDTDTGKSTETGFIRWLLGDYAGQIPVEAVLQKRFGSSEGASPNIADLSGLRYVTCGEPAENARLDVAKLKYLSQGSQSKIKARRLYQENEEFNQTWRIVIDTNHRPVISDADDAIWNRLALVPFDNRIAKGDQDKSLPDKFKAESSGILNWMIQGWRMYCGMDSAQPGIGESHMVDEATSEYRADMDLVRRWIADCCETTEHLRKLDKGGPGAPGPVTAPDLQNRIKELETVGTHATYLFKNYEEWSESVKESALSMKRWGSHPAMQKFRKGRDSKNVTVYFGIGIACGFADEGPQYARTAYQSSPATRSEVPAEPDGWYDYGVAPT
jgi:putative DNA primase/helicase